MCFFVLFFMILPNLKLCGDHILSVFWYFYCPFSNPYIKFGVGGFPLLNIGAN